MPLFGAHVINQDTCPLALALKPPSGGRGQLLGCVLWSPHELSLSVGEKSMPPAPGLLKCQQACVQWSEGELTFWDELQRAAKYSEAGLPRLGAIIQELMA